MNSPARNNKKEAQVLTKKIVGRRKVTVFTISFRTTVLVAKKKRKVKTTTVRED